MNGSRIDQILSIAARVLAVLVALAASVQAALAGRFLSGDFAAIEIHTEMASVLGALVIAMAIIAAVRIARCRQLAGELAVAGLLVAGTAVQAVVANINLLAVHVPLGVAVIALSYFQVVQTFRSCTAHVPAATGSTG